MLFEEEGNIDHVIESAAGMGADEIGDDGLLFPQPLTLLTEALQELFKNLRSRFAHDFCDLRTTRFRCHLEQPTNVVLNQVSKIIRLTIEQIEANPRGDKQVLDGRMFT